MVLLAFLSFAFGELLSYDHHSVWHLPLESMTQSQRDAITMLRNRDFGLDFWSEADIRVSPEKKAELQSFLADLGISHSVLIEDIQPLVQEQRLKSGADWFDSYHPIDEINDWMSQQAATYPNLTRSLVLGKTYQGQSVQGLEISIDFTANKPLVYFEGCIHAREWIACSTMTYLINKLLQGWSTGDANATTLLKSYDFTIVPVINVDGYIWTWTNDRMWRKTRSPNVGSPCIGTDPNRNWDNHWCEQGASTQPCSDSYCGSKAFSEIEVVNAANYAKAHANRLKVFIDFHSYGQLWMGPYGWTPDPPKDADEQARIGNLAVAAIKSQSGYIYEYGRICIIIYPASGSSADWVYDALGTVYSYGIELRDTGEFGFLLPANQIKPQGEEIWASVVAFVNAIPK